MEQTNDNDRLTLSQRGQDAFGRVVEELIRLCQRDGLLPMTGEDDHAATDLDCRLLPQEPSPR